MSDPNNLPSGPVHRLDHGERHLLDYLADQYQRFKQPGPFDKAVATAHRFVPGVVQNALAWGQDRDFVKQVLQRFDQWVGARAREGVAGKYVLTPDSVILDLARHGLDVLEFDDIRACRSYELERAVRAGHPAFKRTAFLQGFATGVPGLPGLPVNLVLSLILYYRAVQATAMRYGFDVREPEELAFASLVLMDALSRDPARQVELDSQGPPEPGAEPFDPEALISILMMGVSADNIVRHLLARAPTTAAASLSLHAALKLHVERLFGQLGARGITDSLENALVRRVFIVFGRRIGPLLAKSAPVLGGVLGGAFDTGLMTRALNGANLVYHRRFLLEKAQSPLP